MSVIPTGGDVLVPWPHDLLDRMERAVERVRDRLRRVTATLEGAGIPYAIVGGNAVASWVARVDEAAVRNTPDVDILLNRSDLEAARHALGVAGFVYRNVEGLDIFLDGPAARARDAVHIVFAGEKVRSDDPVPAPLVTESEVAETSRVVSLEPLIWMKLTSYRLKDRVHIRDMIDVGLIDATWLARVPEPLSARLKTLLDNPEG